VRPGVADAVAQCSHAGVRTAMITGDYPGTALAIAGEIGLDGGGVITGPELSAMTDDELARRIRIVSVFARIGVQPLLRLPGPGQRVRRQAGLPAPEGGPDRWPVPVGPCRLDQGGAHSFRAGLGDVAPAAAGPAGVFGRDQPGEAHERAGGGEPAPVHHLGGQREPGQLGDPPVAAQPGHRAGQRFPARPGGQPGPGRGQFGFPRFQAAAVQREGLGQRRLIEDLAVHPRPVRVTPLLTTAPDAAVAQQRRVQLLLHPLAVIEQVPAGAHQVADRLLGRGWHPDRRQQPRPVGQRQAHRVPLIGLDPVRAALGDQRRGDHVAGHPHRGQQPVQLIAARAGLIAGR